MTHGNQCGFAGELTCFSGVMTRTRSSADLARRNIALQDKYLHRGRPEISLARSKKGKVSRDPEKSLD